MRIAFLVPDVSTQQPSFGGIHLAWAAHRRGHEVRFVSSHDLSFLDDNTVLATTTRVRAGDYRRPANYHAALLSPDAVREEDALSSFDVIFLRYNPLREPAGEPPSPVIDFCWRLRLSGALVINDPEGVRRAWGRLYLADLPPEVRARTVVSRSAEGIKAFLRELDGPAVLKPLAHAGREKVFFLRRRQAKNLNAIISAITRDGYAVAQEYLPEAGTGEKRMLLLGGEPIRVGSQAALYRRPPSPHLHSRASQPVTGRPAAPQQPSLSIRPRRATTVRFASPQATGRRPLFRQCGHCRRQDPGSERLRSRRPPFAARDLPYRFRRGHYPRPGTQSPSARRLPRNARSRGCGRRVNNTQVLLRPGTGEKADAGRTHLRAVRHLARGSGHHVSHAEHEHGRCARQNCVVNAVRRWEFPKPIGGWRCHRPLSVQLHLPGSVEGSSLHEAARNTERSGKEGLGSAQSKPLLPFRPLCPLCPLWCKSYSNHGCRSVTRPTASKIPKMMASGRGGQPGMNTSTGRTSATPPALA